MGFLQPKMSGSKRGGYRWFREIRTTQERRHWDADHGRAARSPHRLPNAWDERTRHVDGSWKRHRTSQFRPKALESGEIRPRPVS
jgi:hypothetical protein